MDYLENHILARKIEDEIREKLGYNVTRLKTKIIDTKLRKSPSVIDLVVGINHDTRPVLIAKEILREY